MAFCICSHEGVGADESLRLTIRKANPSGNIPAPHIPVQEMFPVSENKQPLILIHGWNSNAGKWSDFSKYFFKTPDLYERFDLFLVLYQWGMPIEENGELLYQQLNKQGWKSFSILAHSMGGLVARSAIERHPDLADKLKLLIMLGTPNHGSPMANAAWLQNDSALEDYDADTHFLSKRVLPLYTDGGVSLGWDNSDGQMPQKVLHGVPAEKISVGKVSVTKPYTAVPAANGFTRALNENFPRELAHKYIAIGAYRTVVPSSVDPNHLLNYRLSSTIILAKYFSNDGVWVKNYVANDYVVPLQSALFLDDGYVPASLEGTSVQLPSQNLKTYFGYSIFKNNHHRVKEAIVFENIYHDGLPDDDGVRNKVKALLLSSPPESELKTVYNPPPSAVSADASPILVLDRSGSIKDDAGVMNQVMNRAREVVNAVLKIDGKAAVVNFSGPNNSKLEARFTANANELYRAISFPSINSGKDGTALYDAVVQAVEDTKWHVGNKRVILFTDGKDHQSKKSIADVVRYCIVHNVVVVVVGFVGIEGRDDQGLQQLASGAKGFYVQSESMNIDQVLSRARTHYQNVQGARARGSAD